MARRKKTTTVKDSIFWKPEFIGESIEGTFLNFQLTDKSKVIALDVKDLGQKLIGISTVLFSFLTKETNGKALAERLGSGKDKLKIVFIGKVKRARIFRVWLNDVEQEQERSYKKINAKIVLESVDKKK